MRNAPEFVAIAVWGLFASAVAVAQGAGSGAANSESPVLSAPSEVPAAERLWTGRSAAVTKPNDPYGALFVDPSLGEDRPLNRGPKPSSADLTAQ